MSAQPEIQRTVIKTERLIALELRRAVASITDLLVVQAQEVLDQIGKADLRNNQINALLSIANTTDKVEDITRFLEKQGSRRKGWEQYAERILRLIRGDLSDRATEVARAVASQVRDYHHRSDEEDKHKLEALTVSGKPYGRLSEVHLLIVREFIQSFAIGYLYNYGKSES